MSIVFGGLYGPDWTAALLCCKRGQESGTAHYVRWVGIARIAEAVVPGVEKEAGKPPCRNLFDRIAQFV